MANLMFWFLNLKIEYALRDSKCLPLLPQKTLNLQDLFIEEMAMIIGNSYLMEA